MTLRSLLPLSVCLVLAACDKPAPSPDGPADASAKAPTADATPEAKVKGEQTQPGAHGGEAAKDEAVPATTAAIGQPAPDFTLTDLDGKTHHLADYRGKTVVLEWWNPQCPFVEYAHTKGPLVDMARKEVAQGVVWLAVNSGGPGRQGHGEAGREGVATFGMSHPVLVDEDGAVGHAYGAEKTPHMFLVDERGTLVYRGAIDNAPMGEPSDGGEPVNHLAAALADLRAGKPVGTAQTPAYGCTVKYAKG